MICPPHAMGAFEFVAVAALRAAQLAQEIAESRAGADEITSKGGIDLVTAADVACEDKIREELLRAFPDYPVIGEERGGEPVAGQPYWLVDPICGTRHFASNIPLYCHNIALVENGQVTAAADRLIGLQTQAAAARKPMTTAIPTFGEVTIALPM